MPIFKIGMETATIQDFTVSRENTIRRMIPGFLTHVTTILAMFQSTTVTANGYHKTVMIRNTVIMNGFRTDNVTEFVTPIMTPDGTPMTPQFLVCLAVGYRNFKVNVDRDAKIYREMSPLTQITVVSTVFTSIYMMVHVCRNLTGLELLMWIK